MNVYKIFAFGVLVLATAEVKAQTDGQMSFPPGEEDNEYRQSGIVPPADSSIAAEPVLATRPLEIMQEEIIKLKRRVAMLEEQSRRIQERWKPVAGNEGDVRPDKGTVILNNWTNAVQWIVVNELQFPVNPGRTEVPVPYGPTLVYLANYELPKQWGVEHWKRNGREYQLRIGIR